MKSGRLNLLQTIICKVPNTTGGSIWVKGSIHKIAYTEEVLWNSMTYSYEQDAKVIYTVQYEDPNTGRTVYKDFKRKDIFTAKQWAKHMKSSIADSLELINKKGTK